MRAWLMETRDGGVGKLRLADVPDPRPGAGEVVLDVHYAGLNPADRAPCARARRGGDRDGSRAGR